MEHEPTKSFVPPVILWIAIAYIDRPKGVEIS